MNNQDVEMVTRLISSQRELLANDSELAGQMDRLRSIFTAWQPLLLRSTGNLTGYLTTLSLL